MLVQQAITVKFLTLPGAQVELHELAEGGLQS